VKINYDKFDHTNAGGTYYATRLTGGSTNEKYGLTKTLSVMPGDKISMEVYAKYLDPNTNNWNTALTNFMGAITGGTAPAGTFVDGGSAGSIGGGTYPISGINHTSEGGTAPKAYLNYIVFNKDMTTVLDMGFKRITTNSREYGQDAAHDKLAFEGSEEVLIKEPGYVYIYLSNENETAVEVFFDDFKIEHKKSPVVQMDDYYPFGLTYNSYKRENNLENKIRFQEQEHIDELDLGWDSFKWRNHQPDIGRFFNVDPLAEKYVYNSVYAFSENKVVVHRELEGLEAFFIHGTNSTPKRWEQNDKTIPTIMALTNNKTSNTGFKWKSPITNDGKSRNHAAQELANFVIKNRVKGEEITLVGHSHGGNVAIQASKYIKKMTGEKVNIITIATPAFNRKQDIENPETQKANINDHIAIWNNVDGVSGGLAGDDKYTNSSITTNAEVNVDKYYRHTDEIPAHSFDVVHPEAIEEAKIRKLKPVTKK
jgi:RHS repeat-associated protein